MSGSNRLEVEMTGRVRVGNVLTLSCSTKHQVAVQVIHRNTYVTRVLK
jgi:hypothetical protein